MATHSSILAWRIPWTDEPGRLQSMGSQESDMTEVTERASQGRKLLVGEGNVEKYIHDFGDVVIAEL